MKTYDIDLIQEMNRTFKVKGESPDLEINNITPIVDVRPLTNFIDVTTVTASASTGTITPPVTKEFYMRGITYAIIKDAACDVADGYATLSYISDEKNAATNILYYPLFTLTAQEGNITMLFEKPIKIKLGSGITIGSSIFAAGKMRKSLTIHGYTKEL